MQLPYLWLAACVAVVAALIFFSKFPPITEAGGDSIEDRSGRIRDLLKHKHLMLATLTQFLYVGAQVSIWSYFIDFTKDLSPETTERMAGRLLAYGFLALMIGRFSGGLFMRRVPPNRLLLGYAIVNLGLLSIAITASGWLAIGALWSTTLFMSIMWPTVFALGVRDLGHLTKLGILADDHGHRGRGRVPANHGVRGRCARGYSVGLAGADDRFSNGGLFRCLGLAEMNSTMAEASIAHDARSPESQA